MNILDLPEEEQRRLLVENARTFLGTMWVHMGRARGGVDCGGLPLLACSELGMIDDLDINTEFYPIDFMLHTDEERFVKIVEQFCYRVDRAPKDGDFPLFKVGRVVAHCAIVDKWPRVIHAHRRIEIVDYADATAGELGSKLEGIWTYRGWT